MWDAAQPTRIYARGAGKYGFKMAGRWTANGNGYRYVYVYKNGVAWRPFQEFPPQPIAGRQGYFDISDTLDLADGDYIECYLFHNSTTTPLALQPGEDTTYLCLERIAP
jgi:hypothetical protein